MKAKSIPSFRLGFLDEARVYNHPLKVLKSATASLKKIKRSTQLPTQENEHEEVGWVMEPTHLQDTTAQNNTHSLNAELVAPVATASSSMVSGGSSLIKLLGGLALGGGGGAAAMGGGGGSDGDVPVVSEQLSGNGNGINNSIAPVVLYTQDQVNLASMEVKDLLIAFESNKQGAKWGNALQTGVVLTYSFSVAGQSQYAGNYLSNGSKESAYLSAMFGFTEAQKALALDAMNDYANVSGIVFKPYKPQAQNALDAMEVAGAAGDIRWANTSNMPNFAGETYYPNWAEGARAAGIGGDIWISSVTAYVQNPSWDWARNYVGFLFTHELGHALGLAHPHDTAIDLGVQDAIKYTVMSYNDYVGDTNATRQSLYFPTTMMLNDIAAIQYLYGVNTSIHTENTVYQWSAAANVFETIYDAGGVDTIDASNQLQSVSINLNPGTFSSIGVAFSNGRDWVRDCLAMSYAVTVNGQVINWIENAVGSAYDDSLLGNGANNRLTGNGGNDSLIGGLGDDTLLGGLGMDALLGGAGRDSFVFDTRLGGDNIDRIKDFAVAQGDTIVLDRSIFDALTQTGSLLPSYFVSGFGLSSGQNALQHIIHNSANGYLYYDADGNGAQASICFAIIDNLTGLNASNFVVI